ELAEGEFYELMAENVRSTFLALKAASRLLSSGWVVIVAPPSVGSVQMHAAQGALREMIYGFRRRFAYPRVNLVLPSRPPSDPRHDQALVRAVRYLGSPESAGVTGQVMDVDLPNPPRLADSLLPEVRAALDPNVRQPDEDDPMLWLDDWEDEGDADYEATDDHAFGPQGGDGGAASRTQLSGPAAAGYDGYDDEFEEFDDYDHSEQWAYDLGLPEGPALRHLVANDDPLEGDAYASGHETAKDLYGDLSSLDLIE